MNLLLAELIRNPDLASKFQGMTHLGHYLDTLKEANFIACDFPDPIRHLHDNALVGLYSTSHEEWHDRREELGRKIKPRRSPFNKWTSAVISPDQVYFVPDDHRNPGGDVQFFAQVDGARGRIRIEGHISEGKLQDVEGVSLEIPAHCCDGPCRSDSDCHSGCNECKCILYLHDGIDALKCHCRHSRRRNRG
ncbi:hypothetical protein [Streptomyces europaeiscabiei]|uniref:hypothetical protein n=1 Tax=Streptomyces europaeiscabiei TaxID=146819 RepID=UPI0038F7FB96